MYFSRIAVSKVNGAYNHQLKSVSKHRLNWEYKHEYPQVLDKLCVTDSETDTEKN